MGPYVVLPRGEPLTPLASCMSWSDGGDWLAGAGTAADLAENGISARPRDWGCLGPTVFRTGLQIDQQT